MQVSLFLAFVEQIVDVPMFPGTYCVSQVTEELMEVTMSSSQDRILQSTREQFLDVPVRTPAADFRAVRSHSSSAGGGRACLQGFFPGQCSTAFLLRR